MNISSSILSDKLKKYNPQIYINRPEFTSIYDVEVYEENKTHFEPCILYILKSSDFPILMLKVPNDCNFCVLSKKEQESFFEYRNGNLLILDDTKNIGDIYIEINSILTEYSQYVQNKAKINNLILERKGLKQILNTGYEILGNPLILEDLNSKIISYSENIKFDDSYKTSILTNHLDSYRKIQGDYGIKRELEKVIASEYPLYLKETEKFGRLVSKVVLNNRMIARLSVIEVERLFKESDLEIISLLSKVISCEIQNDKFNRCSKGLTYEYLILDLIEGRFQNFFNIDEMVKECKWDLEENIYILTVEINSANQYTTNNLNKLRDTLQNIVSGSRTIIYNDNIIMVITRNNEKPLYEEELLNLEGFLKKNNMHLGLSRCFNQIQDINQYYQQSLKAIELGLHMNKEKVIFVYENYAVFHMLDVCSRQEELQDFCHPSLFRLMEYDRLNNTCYTHTIYVYLKHEGNHKQSANKLHISCATLVYRIKRIKEIIQDDLSAEDITFQLLLSFKIFEYTSGLKYLLE